HIPADIADIISRAWGRRPVDRVPSCSKLRAMLDRVDLSRAPEAPAAPARSAPAGKKPAAARKEATRAGRTPAEKKALARERGEAVRSILREGLEKLSENDPVGAIAHARRAFDAWPGSPALRDFLGEIEKAGREHPEWSRRERPRRVPAGGFEDIFGKDLDDFIEEASLDARRAGTVTDPEAEATAVQVIRDRIATTDFVGAYEEARKAQRRFPGNIVIAELLVRLDHLIDHETAMQITERLARSEQADESGEGEDLEFEEMSIPTSVSVSQEVRRPGAQAVAVPSATPSRPALPAAPRLLEERRGIPPALLWGLGGLVAAGALVVLVVLPLLSGGGEPVEPVIRPYDAAYVVEGPEGGGVDFVVSGSAVQASPDGSYRLSGADFGNRELRVAAEGYEGWAGQVALEDGSVVRDTIRLLPLGTSEVEVGFSVVLPEGAEEPSPEDIVYVVDGEEVGPDSLPVRVQTGRHVFLVEVEGYEAVPETVLISMAEPVVQPLMVRSPDTAEIRLVLSGDVEGTADWYVDGSRISSGSRSMVHVAPQGQHTLLARMTDREDWVRTITLDEDGYSATVSPELVTRTGRLIIDPEPWANVYINGDNAGQTPLPPIELEAGDYTVRLTNPDYEDQVTTVTVAVGEDSRIRYTSDPIAVEDTTAALEEQPVIPPFAISQTQPVYPSLALEHGDVDGYVTLEVRVGADGSVVDARVTNDEVGLGCGQAALDAVYQWRFSPATQGGVPLESTTSVSMRFYLP
ncbi:TonB family protein, partial [Candidatus Fermentibacterales bacterium]|nr:TonB family protein [Candidatus Fermentibacterales bacterium]